jgi:hypothetical protein
MRLARRGGNSVFLIAPNVRVRMEAQHPPPPWVFMTCYGSALPLPVLVKTSHFNCFISTLKRSQICSFSADFYFGETSHSAYVACVTQIVEIWNLFRILVGKRDGKRPLGSDDLFWIRQRFSTKQETRANTLTLLTELRDSCFCIHYL